MSVFYSSLINIWFLLEENLYVQTFYKKNNSLLFFWYQL